MDQNGMTELLYSCLAKLQTLKDEAIIEKNKDRETAIGACIDDLLSLELVLSSIFHKLRKKNAKMSKELHKVLKTLEEYKIDE